MRSFVKAISLLTLVSACATAQVNVLAGEGGNNRVISADFERADAENGAVDAAHKYCAERHQHAVFSGESRTQYTGAMDEGARAALRGVSRGLLMSHNRQAAPLAFAASAMSHDRDYRAELNFRCE